jgi:hypothetical protein
MWTQGWTSYLRGFAKVKAVLHNPSALNPISIRYIANAFVEAHHVLAWFGLDCTGEHWNVGKVMQATTEGQ